MTTAEQHTAFALEGLVCGLSYTMACTGKDPDEEGINAVADRAMVHVQACLGPVVEELQPKLCRVLDILRDPSTGVAWMRAEVAVWAEDTTRKWLIDIEGLVVHDTPSDREVPDDTPPKEGD